MQEIVLKNLIKDYRSNEAYKSLRTNIDCLLYTSDAADEL